MAEEQEENLPFDENSEAGQALAGGFCITDLQGVNWYLQKVGNIRSQKERLKAQYEAASKRLDSEENSLHYLFGPQVERVSREFLEQRLAQNPKARKSEILQWGTIKLTSSRGGLKVEDTKEALAFALSEVPNGAEVSTYKLGVAFSEFLQSEWEAILTEASGDIEVARTKFNDKFPFARYREDENKFSISV